MNEIVRAADLRDQVYDALRRRIKDGAYEPGHRLTEAQVSKEFGVSRTPAREALVMLSKSGLINEAERGFELPTFTADDIRAIFEIRRLTEPYAVRKIIAETDAVTLKKLCAKLRKSVQNKGAFEDYVRGHAELRRLLFALVSNARLRDLIATFNEQVQFIRMTTLHDAESRERSAAGNRKLVDAIEARDADAAGAHMVDLINMAEALALDSMKQR